MLSTDWRRDPSLKAIITTALGEVGCTVIGAHSEGPTAQAGKAAGDHRLAGCVPRERA